MSTALEQFNTYLEQHHDPKWEASHLERFRQTAQRVAPIVEQCLTRGEVCRVLDIGGRNAFGEALRRTWLGVEYYCTGDANAGAGVDLRGEWDEPAWFDRDWARAYDLILCLEVLEHIADPDPRNVDDAATFKSVGQLNLLRSMREYLAPEGRIVLTTPNSVGWCALARLMRGEPPRMYDLHVRELCPGEVGHLCSRANLRVLSAEGLDDVWPNLPGFSAIEKRAIHTNWLASGVIREDDVLYILARE